MMGIPEVTRIHIPRSGVRHIHNGNCNLKISQMLLNSLIFCVWKMCIEFSPESFYSKLFMSEVYFIGKILNNIQN